MVGIGGSVGVAIGAPRTVAAAAAGQDGLPAPDEQSFRASMIENVDRTSPQSPQSQMSPRSVPAADDEGAGSPSSADVAQPNSPLEAGLSPPMSLQRSPVGTATPAFVSTDAHDQVRKQGAVKANTKSGGPVEHSAPAVQAGSQAKQQPEPTRGIDSLPPAMLAVPVSPPPPLQPVSEVKAKQGPGSAGVSSSAGRSGASSTITKALPRSNSAAAGTVAGAAASGASAPGAQGFHPKVESSAPVDAHHETAGATAAPMVQSAPSGFAAAATSSRTVFAASSPLAASASGSQFLGGASEQVASTAGEARTLQATPNALEVGIASGTHGWLRVRAELDSSGAVTAALVASSASSAESVSRSLPEMSAYLTQESTIIGSIVVHASPQSGATGNPDSAGSGSLSFAGTGNSGNAQANQQPTQTRGGTVGAIRGAESQADGMRGLPGMASLGALWPGMGLQNNGAGMHWVSVRV